MRNACMTAIEDEIEQESDPMKRFHPIEAIYDGLQLEIWLLYPIEILGIRFAVEAIKWLGKHPVD